MMHPEARLFFFFPLAVPSVSSVSSIVVNGSYFQIESGMVHRSEIDVRRTHNIVPNSRDSRDNSPPRIVIANT